MRKDPDKLGILRGTLDILVLKSLSGRPLHGFEISLWLDEESGGSLHLDDSALYQCLHRLEARGYLIGDWGVSENNRRARYYRLTAEGRRHLSGESERLVSYARAIMGLLAAAPRAR
jgi:PadR family transcriptional regulator, regulatory protein PadR